MLEVLKKYSRLSKELRDRLASPEVLLLINELEVKYKTKLASVLMRVMTHDLDLAELEDHFVFTQKLERNMAQELAKILQAKIFSQFAEYLRVDSLKTEIKAVFNENIKTEMDVRINLIVDKARLSFACAVLNNRFREILRTNLIGIRDCINTKE
ncbi:MAG: hypothetical protein NT091_00375, partial [Candidatus Falkowbacteria bacterium]|nr:hypothetical protein [Candidatus Falkowbacteria bacterium]